MNATNKVVVHSYRIYEGRTDTSDIRPVKATAEAIARLGGVIVDGTEEEIDASLLDGNGIYRSEWLSEEIYFLKRLEKQNWTSAGLFDHRQFKRLVDAKLVKDTAVNLSDVLYEITDKGRAILARRSVVV